MGVYACVPRHIYLHRLRTTYSILHTCSVMRFANFIVFSLRSIYIKLDNVHYVSMIYIIEKDAVCCVFYDLYHMVLLHVKYEK